ncbi:MAG: outer membrane protein assembly factor BamD [Betaproteobacteria bacterium]|nr:outer membrane protein assembly factor BamD [Betaproteobacteria bacterium]
MLRILAVIAVALTLSACGAASPTKDATRNWSVERLYKEAKSELNDGNYKRAVSYYEKLSARYPYGPYARQAQLEMAYAYFKDNEPASAIATCDRYIKLYPNGENVDYAYYLKGLVSFHEDQGLLARLSDQNPTERDPQSMRDSFDAFQELVSRFPESRYTPDALKRMRYLVNALASSEVNVAKYYLRRRAYVAAVNRAQYAIKNYPQAPALKGAFEVLVSAYQAMGLTDLKNDAERLLELNFPSKAAPADKQKSADKAAAASQS